MQIRHCLIPPSAFLSFMCEGSHNEHRHLNTSCVFMRWPHRLILEELYIHGYKELRTRLKHSSGQHP